ncbi:L-2-hydroxyglutarate oxidase [uncultured Ferrovibrio sp.]|jgi:L-2-hydroxyglutarate oxidase|uniref:L-2-hydroxyglutarate oxidase n=1 Tax=uncultured Ferrovibrio sp. TaxID=1576913 RepID=UPI00262EF6D9|nr:L-2-hydroxyglutarate oxidase [uncultured Ferrovibrio sp.]
MQVDFTIIGGGIVGISTALHLIERQPGASILVLDKEQVLAAHQTGHNSGVIHAGVYYAPGSLKARFCREGLVATKNFCQQHGLPFETCGKLIVATNEIELARMGALYKRAQENGLSIERLDDTELRRREPRIVGKGALFVSETGIVDYTAVTQAMAEDFRVAGGVIELGNAVLNIREEPETVILETETGTIRSRYLIACAGLMADRLAAMCGLADDFQIVPFRGEYFRLPPAKDDIVRHLIYPVPDPALPFLGVHLTRMIGGFVTVGPNAVLAMKREGYRKSDFNLRDVAQMVSYRGFWNVLRRNLRSGIDEMRNSLFKRQYLALCQKYCPELTEDDLLPYPAGVRAQAVLPDGTLVHDFLIKSTARTMHVCNAPSPAATSAMPIGKYIVETAMKNFQLPSDSSKSQSALLAHGGVV